MYTGVVDIGSNSVRLVIYKIDGGQYKKVVDYKKMLQLLMYIDHQQLTQSGINILIDTLKEFKAIADTFSPDHFACFATASLRFIDNQAEVISAIHQKTSLLIDQLSGDDEATLGFIATDHSLELPHDGLCIDVGGGSTELTYFQNQKPIHVYSLPIGSLSLYLKHVHHLFPSRQEIKNIEIEIAEHLNQVEWLKTVKTDHLIGIGGSARALTKVCRALYNTSKINHGDLIPCDYLHKMAALSLDRNKKQAQIVIETIVDRSTTLLTGAQIFNCLANQVEAKDFLLSRSGIREGFILNRFIGVSSYE